MSRTGNYFEIELKRAHLNWGTEGESRENINRNRFESYLPISSSNAQIYNIFRGEVFDGSSEDNYFQGTLMASGSQGPNYQYGKNLTAQGDMRKLGYWLIDRMKAEPGDRVIVFFTSEDNIQLSLIKD